MITTKSVFWFYNFGYLYGAQEELKESYSAIHRSNGVTVENSTGLKQSKIVSAGITNRIKMSLKTGIKVVKNILCIFANTHAT